MSNIPRRGGGGGGVGYILQRERIRFFRDPLKIKLTPLFILLVWRFNSFRLPDEPVHVTRFGRDGFGVLDFVVYFLCI